MFLLDCYIHTRRTTKWKLLGNHMEISACGEKYHNKRGKEEDHQQGDFTEAMTRILRDYIDTIAEGDDFKAMRRGPESIPEIMRFDKLIYENPKRLFLSRTSKKNKKPTLRIYVDPLRVFNTGSIEFFAKCIGPEPNHVLVLPPIDLLEDEGLGMDESDDSSASSESTTETGSDSGGSSEDSSSDSSGNGSDSDSLFV